MKAIDIYNRLIKNSGVKREKTCDIFISGDPEKEVTRVAVCFKATAELIARAIDDGIELLITHEPVFCRENPDDFKFDVDLKSWT